MSQFSPVDPSIVAHLSHLLRPGHRQSRAQPPTHSYIRCSLSILPLSWLRLLLTLLEALVIHLLVFIVYYGPYRTDNNGSISNSVVDLYLVISLPLTLYIQQFAFPSLSNPLTKSNTHPSCQVSIYSNPFPVPSSPSPFCFESIVYFHTHPPSRVYSTMHRPTLIYYYSLSFLCCYLEFRVSPSWSSLRTMCCVAEMK